MHVLVCLFLFVNNVFSPTAPQTSRRWALPFLFFLRSPMFMAVASELVGLVIMLAMRPFLLMKLACVVGARVGFVVLHTWLEITKASVSLHVSLFWKLILCTVAITLLPFRILNALQRERQVRPLFGCRSLLLCVDLMQRRSRFEWIVFLFLTARNVPSIPASQVGRAYLGEGGTRGTI